MPRTPRVEIAGGIHHLTSQGGNGRPIFHGPADKQLFLRELELVVVKQGWHCLSYNLMTTHYHLVVETPEENLGVGMKGFLGRYVQTLHRRHGSRGPLFNERFHSVPVLSDLHFLRVLRYVACNPVVACLCDDPWQWDWSSHRALMVGRDTPLTAAARLEELLAGVGDATRQGYAWVLAPDSPFGVWREATDPTPPRPPLASLFAQGPTTEAFREARWDHGYRLAEIAAHLGVSEATVSRRSQRR